MSTFIRETSIVKHRAALITANDRALTRSLTELIDAAMDFTTDNRYS